MAVALGGLRRDRRQGHRPHPAADRLGGAPTGASGRDLQNGRFFELDLGVIRYPELGRAEARFPFATLCWQDLLRLDPVAGVRVEVRSVADPLPFLLTDDRHVREQDRGDSQLLRLLDVPRALAAREYLTSWRVVPEVTDDLGLAAARFALGSDGDVAACATTDEAGGLTIVIAALGTVFLGGHHLMTLHEAGRVAVHTRSPWRRPTPCSGRG